MPLEAAHVSKFLDDLSVHIARLSIGLHLSLDTDADIQEAMHTVVETTIPKEDRRSGTEHSAIEMYAATLEHRTIRQRLELRGFLEMRYEAEVMLVEQLGGPMSRRVLGAVAINLERQGFVHGAGGAAVNRTI
jgi:hypothetical protein